MKNDIKILVTGGFGFIGSNLIRFLNAKGITPFVTDTAADKTEQWKNVAGLKFNLLINPSGSYFDIIVHLGANVDTREKMNSNLWSNNFEYSRKLHRELKSPSMSSAKFIYASSASVYGAEEKDFSERVVGLKPLNAYGFSKLMLDSCFQEWLSGHNNINTIGLRFFNVYGPNEWHKEKMASVVHKALNKIYPLYKDYGFENNPKPTWSIFKSHREGIEDGEQMRDFVYSEDVCKVIWHFIENNCESGIYNLGSGKARSFNDLVRAIDPAIPIEYVDMPESIRPHYQYFTQADLTKLRAAGYKDEFTSLEDGIKKTKEALGL